jgi:hypothetical protein
VSVSLSSLEQAANNSGAAKVTRVRRLRCIGGPPGKLRWSEHEWAGLLHFSPLPHFVRNVAG